MPLENKLPEQSAERITIPVIEEQVRVGVTPRATGKVRIAKTVTSETVQVEVPYTQENIEVERIAINEYVDEAPPAVRYEGDVMIVPVLQEVLVKKLLLVEELRVTQVRHSSSEIQEITLRKESVDVQRE
jgi:stress response protein YsnF